MSDAKFSAVVHRNPRILLDVVDDQWRRDKLPTDEISIPPGRDVPADDGDNQPTESQEQLDKKWLELAMDEFQ